MLTTPTGDSSGSGRARHPSHYPRLSPSKDGPLMPARSRTAAGIRIESQRRAPSFRPALMMTSVQHKARHLPIRVAQSASPSELYVSDDESPHNRWRARHRTETCASRVWPAFFRFLYSAVEDRQKDTRIRNVTRKNSTIGD